MKKQNCLLLDIGGTWTRYGIFDGKTILSKKIMPTKDFKTESLKKIILESKKQISFAVISCAGPVENGKCIFTNIDLVLEEKSLLQYLGMPVNLINDFTAAAYYIRTKGKGTLIIGPGTGLGISAIAANGEIFPSEECHSKIEKETFLAIKELKNMLIPEYEQILAGKRNVLLKPLQKEKITLTKDRFTEIYIFVLEEFADKMLNMYKNKKIKKIVLTGGVVMSNKKFFENYAKTMKKKFKKDVSIIVDDYLCLKGTMEYAKTEQI